MAKKKNNRKKGKNNNGNNNVNKTNNINASDSYIETTTMEIEVDELENIEPYWDSTDQKRTDEYNKKYDELLEIEKSLRAKVDELKENEKTLDLKIKEWNEKGLKERENEILELEDELKKEMEENLSQKESIENDRSELEKLSSEIFSKEMEILDKEVLLKEREDNAKLGFINEKKEILDEYVLKVSEATKSVFKLYDEFLSFSGSNYEKVTENIKNWEDNINGNISSLIEKQSKFETELFRTQEEVLDEISEVRKDIFKKESELRIEKEFFEDDKVIEITSQKKQSEFEIKTLKQEIEYLNERIKNYEEQISEEKLLELKNGVLSKEKIVTENKLLKEKLEAINADLKLRLPIEEQEQIELLNKQVKQLYEQIDDNKRMISHYETIKTNWSIKTSDLDSLKKREDQLLAIKQSLEKDNEDLRKELNKYTSTKNEDLVFASCCELDKESKEHVNSNQVSENIDARKIVSALRQKIYEYYPEKRLIYLESDIRGFLSGMAMSKLIILEGISGTGKSSLPHVLSKVINADCNKIEVQAGWRDRHDLLGYYNSFEKKYYESPFLISLYKSQLGNNLLKPSFILLDEMNLSHPEYYFADFLSELENHEVDNRKIKLLPKDYSIRQYPDKFLSNNEGLFVKIPSNVWFIGTANNDETTMGFADKTYDRAFVLELPDNKPDYNYSYNDYQFNNISFEDLTKIFISAKNRWNNQVEKVQKIFNNKILPEFKRHFKISWGNRLDEGIKNFTSANLELGGSIYEAIDYLLAFKVLHKIKDRKDFKSKEIEEFEFSIDEIREEEGFNDNQKFVKSEHYFHLIKGNGID